MKTKAIKILMLALMALAVTNCGSAEDPGIPPIAGQCGQLPGTVWNGYQCVQPGGPGGQCAQYPGTVWNGSSCVPLTAGTFDQYCYQSGGVATTGYNNSRKCVRQMSNNSALPILNATNPFSGSGLSVAQVRVNDVVEYQFQACWKVCTGAVCSLTNWNGSCNGINQDGADENGSLQYLGSLPQGVIGTDGTDIFFLGNGAQTGYRRTMARDGFLRVGINASAMSMSSAQYQIRVSTCIDANGQSIVCP